MAFTGFGLGMGRILTLSRLTPRCPSTFLSSCQNDSVKTQASPAASNQDGTDLAPLSKEHTLLLLRTKSRPTRAVFYRKLRRLFKTTNALREVAESYRQYLRTHPDAISAEHVQILSRMHLEQLPVQEGSKNADKKGHKPFLAGNEIKFFLINLVTPYALSRFCGISKTAAKQKLASGMIHRQGYPVQHEFDRTISPGDIFEVFIEKGRLFYLERVEVVSVKSFGKKLPGYHVHAIRQRGIQTDSENYWKFWQSYRQRDAAADKSTSQEPRTGSKKTALKKSAGVSRESKPEGKTHDPGTDKPIRFDVCTLPIQKKARRKPVPVSSSVTVGPPPVNKGDSKKSSGTTKKKTSKDPGGMTKLQARLVKLYRKKANKRKKRTLIARRLALTGPFTVRQQIAKGLEKLQQHLESMKTLSQEDFSKAHKSLELKQYWEERLRRARSRSRHYIPRRFKTKELPSSKESH